MHLGDLRADGLTWQQVFADNFAGEDTPLGRSCADPHGFPYTTPKWRAYPWPWHGDPNGGSYCPGRTTSIGNGVMDIWLHGAKIGGEWHSLIDAPMPAIPGHPFGSGQLYGRYSVEFYEPRSFSNYHVSWLLWPDSNRWPADGEIDFPEADTSGKIAAFLHWQGANGASQQAAYGTSTRLYGGWHQTTIVWLPRRCTFILDGKVVGSFTTASEIPKTPLHLVLQIGRSNDATSSHAAQGHIYIDWVTVYQPLASLG